MSTVLVVDDDSSTRFVLRLVLEREGHEVVEAPDGKAALEAIRANAVPDVVTTDLRMPVLGGEELISRLRSDPATAAIPIVVISSNPDGGRALHASGLVEAFVEKPFEPARLAQCISSVTGGATLRRASA